MIRIQLLGVTGAGSIFRSCTYGSELNLHTKIDDFVHLCYINNVFNCSLVGSGEHSLAWLCDQKQAQDWHLFKIMER